MPERIQLSRRKGWRKPENTVVVARPSKWGNPYKVGMRGFLTGEPFEVINRAHAVLLYRQNLAPLIDRRALEQLRGKNLACWCPLVDADGNPIPCHADVLLELARGGES